MEDIFKFLFVIGIIAIGIAKQVKKEKEKQTAKKTPAPTIPPYKEMQKKVLAPPPATKTERGKESPRPFLTGTPESTSHYRPVSPAPTKQEDTAQPIKNSPDFNVHSVEEVRKAIIWSEILQRKY